MLKKPIAITMGDPNGVGPEILLRSYRNRSFDNPTIVFGDMSVILEGKHRLGIDVPVKAISEVGDATAGFLNV